MIKNITFWSITVALSGFLLGFDTVVVSGMEQTLQRVWNTSDIFHGLVVISPALWGMVFGAMFGSIPVNRIGRKHTLILIGIVFIIAALGASLCNSPYIFALFRFAGGLAIGMSTIAAPAYVAEIAPPESRGRLVALYQINIVLGILVAYISNYLLMDSGPNAWRYMLGIQVIPAFLFLLLVLGVPFSPRWLLMTGRYEEAMSVLNRLYPEGNFEDILERINREENLNAPKGENIFNKKFRKPLIYTFLIAFFNQMSGINAVLYFAPRIFKAAGLADDYAYLSTIGVGQINLVFTVVGLSLIDMLGRKPLMYWGSIGYICSLSMVAAAFYFDWGPSTVPAFIFLFIAAHAFGQGAVIWVFIAEIFPNHLRGAGQSFGSSVHWILAALIPASLPGLFGSVGPALVFAFFAFMMVLQLIFVHFMMPETKGETLEKLSEEISGKQMENI
ncbi:sugar porter family MFS transporter [Robertkochia solimangrovi]|uniref:sugar porter family MFS transporter n=1 Tax=Robertkochia solimangrovi TaxID=2213046 RepID=UPI00117C1491|nr:sugar porter family MFS transporter [Robertkochia solimangrovi]TRZ43275.1 MFS transporter [Robertkochia solimangrovi]